MALETMRVSLIVRLSGDAWKPDAVTLDEYGLHGKEPELEAGLIPDNCCTHKSPPTPQVRKSKRIFMPCLNISATLFIWRALLPEVIN